MNTYNTLTEARPSSILPLGSLAPDQREQIHPLFVDLLHNCKTTILAPIQHIPLNVCITRPSQGLAPDGTGTIP